MYRVAGYLIRNTDNVVVQYAPSRQAAIQNCQQANGTHTVTQIFEWVNQPYDEPSEPVAQSESD